MPYFPASITMAWGTAILNIGFTEHSRRDLSFSLTVEIHFQPRFKLLLFLKSQPAEILVIFFMPYTASGWSDSGGNTHGLLSRKNGNTSLMVIFSFYIKAAVTPTSLVRNPTSCSSVKTGSSGDYCNRSWWRRRSDSLQRVLWHAWQRRNWRDNHQSR